MITLHITLHIIIAIDITIHITLPLTHWYIFIITSDITFIRYLLNIVSYIDIDYILLASRYWHFLIIATWLAIDID